MLQPRRSRVNGLHPLCVGVCTLLISTQGLGATLRVPIPFPAIQAALDASAVDDTVLVSAGNYLERIQVPRRVVLLSEAGPGATTINAENKGTVVFVTQQAEGTTISGFTIKNGVATMGYLAGGIHCDVAIGSGGHATIRNNIVEHNQSDGQAGGIFASRGSTIEDNLIQYNNQSPGKGVSALWAGGTVRRNTIRSNGSIGDFFIVTVQGTPLLVEGNVIVDNAFPSSVLGVEGSMVVIRNNTIANNGCMLYQVEISGGTLEFSNNIITHQWCDGLGCEFTSGTQVVRCNNVWGSGAHYSADCQAYAGIEGNVSVAPLFCDESHGDYRLRPESPCSPEHSPVGCGLVGALPVCSTSTVSDVEAPSVSFDLRVDPNPAKGVARFLVTGDFEGTSIEVIDSTGRIADILHPLGTEIQWVPKQAASSVYFAKMRSGESIKIVKFVLIR